MMSPAEVFRWIIDAIRRLFSTPIAGWTWGQWFLALFLLSLVSSCAGRCCGGGGGGWRRRNRGSRRSDDQDGYYAYRSHGDDGADENHDGNRNRNRNSNGNAAAAATNTTRGQATNPNGNANQNAHAHAKTRVASPRGIDPYANAHVDV